MKKIITYIITMLCLLPSLHAESPEKNDSIVINSLKDADGESISYVVDMDQDVFLNEEDMDMTSLLLYFDLDGGFVKYELKPDAFLTKMNGKLFSKRDYSKLSTVLSDPSSAWMYYEYDSFSVAQCENQFQVDAVTGASQQFAAPIAIYGAIKMTYLLWNVVHKEIPKQLNINNSKKYF